MSTKMWIATQTYVEMDVVIQTVALGVWFQWADALEYVSQRDDFSTAIVTSQSLDGLAMSSLPLWSWEIRPGLWETVAIVPLDVSS